VPHYHRARLHADGPLNDVSTPSDNPGGGAQTQSVMRLLTSLTEERDASLRAHQPRTPGSQFMLALSSSAAGWPVPRESRSGGISLSLFARYGRIDDSRCPRDALPCRPSRAGEHALQQRKHAVSGLMRRKVAIGRLDLPLQVAARPGPQSQNVDGAGGRT
jgi:hypothetical protein